MKQNRLSEIVNAAGGLAAFARKMGWRGHDTSRLRQIVDGGRVPAFVTRDKMIRASGNTITHEEILEAVGREKPDYTSKGKVDPHWDDDYEDRRDWIAGKAAAAARAQRLANERGGQ